jgi:signal transduction histidine kinase
MTASTDESKRLLREDLGEVRLGQARLLLGRTLNSCLIVEGVIIYFAALILFAGNPGFAGIWLALTSAMVLTVFVYSRFFKGGITRENHRRYLRGHTIISGITGLVWTGLAIAYLDPSSTLNLFISINMVASIALGGMLPSAEYRPTFISLSTCMFLPFSIYWLVTVDGSLRLIGVGILILYGFGLLVSARSELQTIGTLAAERNQRLYRLLQEQNRKIEKASTEKTRFLAATSHDMSQPLQAQGFFIRALRDAVKENEQIKLLDKIEAAWRNQKNLLLALGETARLSSGAIIVRPTVFKLQDALDDLQAEFAVSAAQKSITLKIARSAAAVKSDPLLVVRILRNLLSNAIKFTPRNGEVCLTTSKFETRLWIEVEDNGSGVPVDQQDLIFEEHTQLDNALSGEEKGLGLGLSIVRQLADKMDIPLEFDSQLGRGTRVCIGLPLAASAPRSPKTTTPDQPIAGSPLVILIEDAADVRDSLSMLLTQWGCRVIAAETGDQARNLLSWANEIPTMIIADKRLPDGENGIDVIAVLRDEVLKEVPAILLTGDVYQFDGVSELPALEVIPKPAEGPAIRSALLDAIANQPA